MEHLGYDWMIWGYAYDFGNLHSSSTLNPTPGWSPGTFAAPVVQKLELGKDRSGRHKGFGGKSWRDAHRDLAVSNTGKSYEKVRVS